MKAGFFKRKVIENKTRVLIFFTNLPKIFLILRITERDMIKNVHWASCKLPLLLSYFNET
jgi:hypothetical protein